MKCQEDDSGDRELLGVGNRTRQIMFWDGLPESMQGQGRLAMQGAIPEATATVTQVH